MCLPHIWEIRCFGRKERLNSLRFLNFRANICFKYNLNPCHVSRLVKCYLNFQCEPSTSLWQGEMVVERN